MGLSFLILLTTRCQPDFFSFQQGLHYRRAMKIRQIAIGQFEDSSKFGSSNNLFYQIHNSFNDLFLPHLRRQGLAQMVTLAGLGPDDEPHKVRPGRLGKVGLAIKKPLNLLKWPDSSRSMNGRFDE